MLSHRFFMDAYISFYFNPYWVGCLTNRFYFWKVKGNITRVALSKYVQGKTEFPIQPIHPRRRGYLLHPRILNKGGPLCKITLGSIRRGRVAFQEVGEWLGTRKECTAQQCLEIFACIQNFMNELIQEILFCLLLLTKLFCTPTSSCAVYRH